MSDIKDLLKITVDIAHREGAKDVIAKLSKRKEHQIRFSNSQIDTIKQWNLDLLEIFLAIGRRFTVISVQNPNKESIEKKIGDSVKILKQSPKSFLYWGMEKKKQSYKKIDGLYDDRIKEFPNKAPDLVMSAINASLEEGAKKVAGVLYFGDYKTGVLTGYENGGVYDSSYYRLTIRAFVDAESSGQDIVVGRNLDNIEKKFEETGKNAGKLAKMAVGGKQGKPGKYDVILTPTVAANVFNHLVDGANVVYLIGQMTPLRFKLNKKVGPENLNISDDATIPEGLNSRPFDFEGTPSQKTEIIKNGIFTNIIHNTSSAKLWPIIRLLLKKLPKKAKSTGNSYLGGLVDEDIGPKVLAPIPSNYIYEPGDYSVDEIIAESKKPTLLITSNWYTRFTSYLEGKFSTIPRDGMFLIENGEIKKPVRKLRLTETLLGMFERIEAIGNDQKQIMWWEVPTSTFIPTFKIKDCTITAATQ
ncbi:MAG: TldD/PmbA family protein [Promethearchaeota archaeon]